jgi:hypothetical protein
MTTTASDLALDPPAGFWRRMLAGVFGDLVFLMTVALVLFLEILVAVPMGEALRLERLPHARN